jgi:hypothetical protein
MCWTEELFRHATPSHPTPERSAMESSAMYIYRTRPTESAEPAQVDQLPQIRLALWHEGVEPRNCFVKLQEVDISRTHGVRQGAI